MCRDGAADVRSEGTRLMAKRNARRPLRVAIVGGGIGGLAVAVALTHRGVDVQVYERSNRLEAEGLRPEGCERASLLWQWR